MTVMWFRSLSARVVHALIRRWQARCDHDPRLARADILEGDGMNLAVSWCPVCGAYQRGWQMKNSSDWTWGEWRSPRADFEEWLGLTLPKATNSLRGPGKSCDHCRGSGCVE